MNSGSLRMQLQLNQKLTPQLIQSLQLLQLPLIELEQKISEELVENPFLDEENEPVVADTPSASNDEYVAPSIEEKEEKESNRFDWETYIEAGFDQENYRRRGREQIEERDMPIEAQLTLSDQLYFQLTLAPLSGDEMVVGQHIIVNINGEGFLEAVSLEEIAQSLDVPVGMVHKVLKVIHTFEPTGIGARSISECLILQLRELKKSDPLTEKIITEYMGELEKRHFTQIARALKVTEAKVITVLKKISGLNPHPGMQVAENVVAVTPDVTIEKIEGEYVVTLNDRRLPSLRINPYYRAIIKDRKDQSADAKKFVTDKLNSARWLIKAIEQRRNTIVRVAEYIVGRQVAFLERGVRELRPMIMQEVADALSLHVATVARVASGKYMQTPRGFYEFKYFFSTRIATEGAGDISAKSVKDRLQEMIADEDEDKPLSDQHIVDILNKEGVKLARRTVAKYRTQLKILPARYRRRI